MLRDTTYPTRDARASPDDRYRGQMDRQPRNSATAKRPSLGTVLELVHLERGMTRADLTTRTGLNRSTIAAIVGELADLGLVVEVEAPGERRVGRPSPLVVPADAPVVLAVNPEVDAVELAIVGLGARVEHRSRVETGAPPTPERVTEIVAAELRRLAPELDGRRILAVGLAVPGVVRDEDGVVRWAPHLGWRDVPIAELVAAATALPTRADNDASLGALAEHRFGAGVGVDDLVYLNGGASGIGGGVITGGAPLRGRAGYTGEFGQNRPGVAEPDDRVTEHGTVEDEVSRSRLLAMLGLPTADEAVFAQRLAASVDPAVRAELARQRRVLAVALANAVNVLNPSLLVLGGSLASLRDGDPAAFDAAVAAAAIPVAMEGVRIVPAALAADRLLIGAAELAFAPLLADPVGAA
jgi:predicted NBD/HSP70 family sugar kinase